MCKKLIASTLVVALMNLLGCYSSKVITVPEYKRIAAEDKPNEIIVKTKDSKVYHFPESNFYIKNDTLFGNPFVEELSTGGKIPLSEIELIQTKNHSIAASYYRKIAAKSNKPEIYVIKYDSKRYHFMKDDYYIQNDTLFSKGKLLLEEKPQKISLSEIESIQFESADGVKTTLLVIGIVGVSIIILALLAINASLGDL